MLIKFVQLLLKARHKVFSYDLLWGPVFEKTRDSIILQVSLQLKIFTSATRVAKRYIRCEKRYIRCEKSVKNLPFFFCLIVACGKCIYVFGGYNGLERKHHGEVYSLSTGAVSCNFFPRLFSSTASPHFYDLKRKEN